MFTDTGNTEAKALERRILIVDDNAAILRLLGSLFAEEDIDVRLAGSAAAAKDLLETEQGRFDLVLTDIAMPGESGFDLLTWMKRPDSRYSELPVLLMTAQLPEAEYRLKGLSLGAVDYVVRPLELRELVIRSINAINHFQRVKHLEHMLQDAGNLATVGRLLAASSHEIKNLAALVNLASDRLTRLLDGVNIGTQAQQLLKTLTESSSLLTDVARNTTSLLDPPGTNLRPIDLAGLVKTICSLMQSRVQPHGITIDVNPLWALGHANRLKQVLINLILNASEAISELAPPEGGSINVSVRRLDDDDDHDDDHKVVAIEVRDNGIGLTTPGERTEFQAFATTKKLRGGQGLGLWLCARLLEGMGGQLSLISEGVGLGATARICLPIASTPSKDDTIDLSSYFIN